MMENNNPGNNKKFDGYASLEHGVFAALERYSNVHRGSGHNSMVSTRLYDQAGDMVLEFLGLKKAGYTVIFCTPARADALMAHLESKSYQCLSSLAIGLSLGVRALAVKKSVLPGGAPVQTGGGTTRLISRDWVIWADAPGRFEAGTPAIINVIAFARALRLIQQYGKDIFMNPESGRLTLNDLLYKDELEKFSGRELLEKLSKTMAGQGLRGPTMEGQKPLINMDNSASTPAFVPVWNTFRLTLQQPDKVKEELVQEVKSICAAALGAPPADYDVIFTSNTTEAINIAAESLSRTPGEDSAPVVLNTILEHSSNDLPWRMVDGVNLIRLSVDAEGFVDLNELDSILKEYNLEGRHGNKRIGLVALSGASNVLGICNDIAEISRIVHRHGAKLLIDAAQLVAHRKVDMTECGIDFLAFSAHKVYAPFGCGVLVAGKGLLNFNSAELDLIRSSGEENAGGIAALGKSLVLLQRVGLEVIREEEQALTAMILKGMAQIPGLRVYGVTDPDSPGFGHKIGVIVFGMKGMMPNRVANELALQSGIGVRYGCHCAHILIKHLLGVSPSVERLQRLLLTLFPSIRLPGLVRISLGIGNSREDIESLIRVLAKIAGKSATSADRHSAIAQPRSPNVKKSIVKKQMQDFVENISLKVYGQS